MVQIVLEFEILQFHMKKIYISLICIQIPENVEIARVHVVGKLTAEIMFN
jgi:hypothetical protein